MDLLKPYRWAKGKIPPRENPDLHHAIRIAERESRRSLDRFIRSHVRHCPHHALDKRCESNPIRLFAVERPRLLTDVLETLAIELPPYFYRSEYSDESVSIGHSLRRDFS